MSRVAYVNGRFVPHGQAAVHIEDRGYQLSDGIYEVWSVMDGKLADAEGHFARLDRSLGELSIAAPMDRRALTVVLRETIRRNRVREGLLYLQVTRGVARRDHAFPSADTPPAIVVTCKSIDRPASEARAAKGVAAVTVPENRWGRCDIKTIALLPNVLARQQGKEKGAYEALFVDDLGLITEGAASNAWIIDKDGVLRTRDTQANILRGITRSTLMQVIAAEGLKVEERAFSLEEARSARELFISGAGALIMPVVKLDGQNIGDGKPGPVAKKLRELYIARARDTAC
jgi:D-alanine transaminase